MFKRNIWTLFIILIAGGGLFLVLASLAKWDEIQSDYSDRQRNLVNLISNATNALFVTQEMMLDILGNELIKDETYKHQVESKRILNDLLALNPSIVAFGLATPEGKLTFVSSNLDPDKLPNLKEQAASKDSFNYALQVEKMVLGRTYFMAALDEWIIPIRKAIKDKDGTVLAVMTAGIRVSGASKLFRDELHFGSFHAVQIIRNQDYYEQFHSAADTDLHKVYDNSVPEEQVERAIAILTKKYSRSIESIMASEASYDYEIMRPNGLRTQVAVEYDNRYELWTVSSIEYSRIIGDFKEALLWYVLTFLAVTVTVFALFRYIATAENRKRKELLKQATLDPLTKLPNRGYLQQHITDWIYPGAPSFSVLYIDMDHFKSVNDSFGHQFGDAILCELAARLRECTRDKSVVVRQGGDEFLIFTDQVDNQQLVVYGKEVITALSSPCRIAQFSITLGASVGIAKYPEHGDNLDMLLRAADIAMYESKKHKHSVHLFADTMQEGYLNRLEIERHLRSALVNGEMFMVYQPQVDAHGKFFGVESLLRWNNPELGFVPPDHFIPVAEAAGLMPALGSFVLTRTLAEMYALQQSLNRTWQISINISVRQFMQTGFIEELKRAIEESSLSRANVTLEITESLFIEDVDYIVDILNNVHELGVRISMDDFGTGYSSLSMLRKLPIDELKIDKSFVDTLLNDRAAQKMIQNIIAIGKNLEMTVLAEGVETKEQETMLKSFDCDCFQGYFYSRPLPKVELKEVLEAWSWE